MIGVTQLLSKILVPNLGGQTGVELDPIPTAMGVTTTIEAGSYVRDIDVGDHGRKVGVGRNVSEVTTVYSLTSPGSFTGAAATTYDINHYRGVNWNYTGTQQAGRGQVGNTTYYSLTTPWTVPGPAITPGINFNNMQSIVFSSDGFHFTVWNNSNALLVYKLSAQNDITSTPTLLGTYSYNSSSRAGIYSSSNTTGFTHGRLVRNGNYFCGYRGGTGRIEIYSLASPYDLTTMTLVRNFLTPNASDMAIDPAMKSLAWYTSDSTATVYTAALT